MLFDKCFTWIISIQQMEKLSPRKSRSHEGFLALNSIMKANIFRNQCFGGLKAFKSEMNELG